MSERIAIIIFFNLLIVLGSLRRMMNSPHTEPHYFASWAVLFTQVFKKLSLIFKSYSLKKMLDN